MMHMAIHLLPWAVLTLASCASAPRVSDSDTAEFQSVAERFQQLYLGGGENCERILPALAEDIEMLENGRVWTYEDLQEYGPYLPKKNVIRSWSDRSVLTPDLAYDFVTAVFEDDAGAQRRETTCRLWRKTAGAWKIVRMNNVLGPIPREDAGQ